MTENDKPKFCEVVAAMAVVHGRPADAPLFAGWWMAMHKWELKDFQDAAEIVMHTAMYMPTPAAFHALKRAGMRTSGEAWTQAMSRCTQWRDAPQYRDRVERAVNAVGGYRALAMAEIETQLPHIERRFKIAYDELTDVEETRKALPGIAPSAGIENRSQPVLIGYSDDDRSYG